MNLVENTRVSWGKNITPSGEEYYGIKVTIGNILDPESVERTYADIEQILKASKKDYQTHETKTSSGTFRSYSVST